MGTKESEEIGIQENHNMMREITDEDYKEFIKTHDKVTIENVKVKIGQQKKIVEYQPKDFELEKTNIWSFPERGTWATHRGNFRGNWPPQMARNLITRYSKLGETVLDQMCGSGTTLIECKLLGRNAIGVDINPNCIMLTRDRLNFNYSPLDLSFPNVAVKTYIGDARNLNSIEDKSVNLIATHPPYASIIAYNKKEKIPGDLSAIRKIDEYAERMKEIAKESYRVLMPGRFCGILVGDTRRHRHHVPIAFRVMQAFLDAGFILREDIVKYQWKTKTTRERWGGLTKVADECWVDIDKQARRGYYMDFYLLFYEHLFVFRKPEKDEDVRMYKDSIKWWSDRLPAEKVQCTRLTHATQMPTTNLEELEIKLNPYGFIYIPKKALASLPFKIGDKLHLKIDKATGSIIITQYDKLSPA
jgi:DNA modification methylase